MSAVEGRAVSSGLQTVTLVADAPEPEVIQMVLQFNPDSTVKGRVTALMECMQASHVFTPQEETRFNQWKEQLLPKLLTALQTAKEGDDASLALCMLLVLLVIPAQLREEDYANLDALEAFENEIKSLLDLTVPDGQTAKQYLDKITPLTMKAVIVLKILKVIKNYFANERSQRYESANEKSDLIVSKFEELRDRIRLLTRNDQASIDKIKRELTRVTGIIDEEQKKLQAHAAAASGIADRMEASQRVFKQLSNECYQALQQVKA